MKGDWWKPETVWGFAAYTLGNAGVFALGLVMWNAGRYDSLAAQIAAILGLTLSGIGAALSAFFTGWAYRREKSKV